MAAWKNWFIVAGLASATACGGNTASDAGTDVMRTDAARDATVTDVPVADTSPPDTGTDAGPVDVAVNDVAMDTGNDAAPDASADAGPPDVVPGDVTLVDGGACGAIIDLTTAGTRVGDTTYFAADDTATAMDPLFASTCGSPDHQLVLAYTARAACTLDISTIAPGTATTFDTLLSLRSDCTADATGEIACNDDHLPDRRSTLLSPPLTAGQTVYIVVGGSTTAGTHYVDHGVFEITVTENSLTGPCDPAAPPGVCGPAAECVALGGTPGCHGYTESRLAAPTWIDACATGTRLTLAGDMDARDDGHSPALTIPFAFNFYGTDYTRATAVTNGYLRLGTDPTTDSYDNALPFDDGPLVAPWHDDLTVPDSPAGDLCSVTVGTGATAQFVVEWLNVSNYGGHSVSTTFEVVLSATTNTVDFIYQTLTSSPEDAHLADGSNAAIGLEGDDRATIVQHMGPVTAGSGLRYTPMP